MEPSGGNDMASGGLLERITGPEQLRGLSEKDLAQLAEEIRAQIESTVSCRGGHLASNLGVAELTIALHTVFDFSHDALLWDVGHQCYAHKIITGRMAQFGTLRQSGGISGFLAPGESPYDLFATGHAGAAVSTGMGLAWADQFAGGHRKVVAVVGDASIVNGLALEGINNLSLLNRQFLIVLNDNSMAIDRTRGAIAQWLDRLRTMHAYVDAKHATEGFLKRMPGGGELTERIRDFKTGLKTTIHGGQVFDALGLEYYGPIDGHNIHALLRSLRRLAEFDRPVLLHVHTQKGRGRQYAVDDPCRFHSPSAYHVNGNETVFPEKGHPSWTEIFARELIAQGRANPALIALTAAMPDGTGLAEFRREFPDRCLDVGISESHAVAAAGGMAKAGLRPVVAIYSTFLQRAIDQIFEEVALQNLPVVFAIDRAGLVGSDGACHQGFMDIAYLRPMPGMVLMAPADAPELREALALAMTLDTPSAIRYPRDAVGDDLPGECPPFQPGRARIVRDGADGAFLCYGVTVAPALEAAAAVEAASGRKIAVVNARFAKPLDADLIGRLLAAGQPMVLCEDHAAIGGFGSAVLELAASLGLSAARVRQLALPDRFIPHAGRDEQLLQAGLDPGHMIAVMNQLLSGDAPTPG
ncbi:MAG: 1-deoxy-D-xylulose-5-phosphate synthase [Planctomycetota bacterium]|nr:1-deoxy-D-xylulose-5-phosphate synthase [Planctomycetota bacterium]